jgi:hypothetical protein
MLETVLIASDVQCGLHDTVHNAPATHRLIVRWRFRQHDDAGRMLHDVSDSSFNFRSLRPERLPIREAVRHQRIIEAGVDSILFIERRKELNMKRWGAEPVGRRLCGPTHSASPSIEAAQAQLGVDDNHLGARL